MAIYPLQSNFIIDVDIITTTPFKAGMVLMRDDNGRAIPADNSTLLYKTIQQKAGKHLGFASSDHDVTGLTIVEPDVVGSSWLDSNRIFQRYENSDIVHTRRFIAEHLDLPYDVSNPSNRSVVAKRGIGVYNQSGELYATDQFKPVLHGDFGQDYTDIQTINPGDLLTVGSGVNAGKMVKVNVNSIGTDIIVVGIVDRYDTNSGLLYFKNAFYSITFSSSSAILALDAGNSLSFPNTGSIGTVCGTANENGSFTLTAPSGHVFDKVLFASYGNPEGTCGNFTLGSCNSATSLSVVESALLGNNSATLTASNGVFGDPCMGVNKRLYVQARFAPTLAKDLTVFNNSGTLTNGVTYDTAGGGSWSFDGTNDYIQNNSFDGTTISLVTLSLWFYKPTAWSNSYKKLAIAGSTLYVGLGISEGPGPVFYFIIGLSISGQISINAPSMPTVNQWHLATGTWDGTTMKFYIDGILVSSSAGSGTFPGTSDVAGFRVGYGYGFEYFNGKIADVRLYKRALTASEILAYYNATKSRYGL